MQAKEEAKQQYAERQAEKFGRLAKYSLDEENRDKYGLKAKQWKNLTDTAKMKITADKSTEKYKDSSTLTEDEEAAVIRYISPDSYLLNDKLRRDAESELTDFEKEWIQNLNQALVKMPNYEGDLNRSMTFPFDEDAQAFFDSLVEGEEYVPNQYLSTTKDGIYNDDGQVQIFIQNAKQGRDLGELNDMEKEVLYPIGSRFKVLNKVQRDGKWFVLLEEA